MSNDNLETFDDFIRRTLSKILNMDPEECVRLLEADEMAQATKSETHFDLGDKLQHHQEYIEGISNDDPDWVYAEDFTKAFPQWFLACILIGQRLADVVRKTLNEAKLQEILDDADLQRKTLDNICQQQQVTKRLRKALQAYLERLERKVTKDNLKAFSKKRRKRVRSLLKRVVNSILLMVLVSLIIRVASVELMKTPRNNSKP